MLTRRLRWALYDRIDRADTYCALHPWVPLWVKVQVGRWWEWTFRAKTWTAVGDSPFSGAPAGVDVTVPSRWDADGVPTSVLRFSNTHPRGDTCEQGCVIHNRTAHHMQHWPLHWRGDRKIFERICTHGVGHPDPDQGPYWASADQDWQWVHGCCGCCRNPQPPFPEEG